MISRRAGLTIIEVVVLVLIAGLLISALLIYIYQSRQAAARVQCANNLRILGEGTYHFRGGIAREFLEEGLAGPPLPAARIASGYATWAVQLAAYLQPVGELKNWDLQEPYFDQPAAVRRTKEKG